MKKFFAILGICFLFTYFTLMVVLRLPQVRERVAHILIEEVKKESGMDLTIENLTLYPSFHAVAENIQLTSPNSKIIADHFGIEISPLALIQKEVVIEQLLIEKLTLEGSGEGGAAGVPELPQFSLNHYHIRQLHHPDLPFPLEIEGELQSISDLLTLKAKVKHLGSITDELQIKLSHQEDRWIGTLNGIYDHTHFEGEFNYRNTLRAQLLIPKYETLEQIQLDYVDSTLDLQLKKDGEPFSLSLPIEIGEKVTRITLSHDLPSLLDLFDIDTSNLKGTLNLILTFDPEFKATAELQNGLYELVDLGSALHDIRTELSYKDGQVLLQNLQATDGQNGLVSGNGTISLAKATYELNLELQKMTAIALNYTSATGTGNLLIKGDQNGLSLSGDITADRAVLVIPERAPELAETIPVTYINQTTKPLSEAASSLPLKLDLKIDLPKGKVEDKELKSKWAGKVHLTGTASDLNVEGEIKLLEGTYRTEGKNFKLTQGSLTFAGDPTKKTTLHAIAEIQINRNQIEVVVKGPINNPTYTFRSNPPMSQREILSWIIFGQGVTDLTPFEGRQVNESIRKINKDESGPNALTKIRQSIGIDTIDLSREKGDDEEGISLKVGKYITDSTYLSVSRKQTTREGGETSATTSLGIETNLTKQISLEAEVGDDSTGQVNLWWKKDY